MAELNKASEVLSSEEHATAYLNDVRSRRVVLKPLSREEQGRCELCAERVLSGIRTLYHTLPEHARSPTGMARHLGIVRNTCQRISTALAEQEVSSQVLAKLPGPEGLGHFIKAIEAHGADTADIASAESAVQQFQTLMRELAGSQVRLAERIRISPAAVSPSGGSRQNIWEESREALYAPATQLSGHACEVMLSIQAYRMSASGSECVRERAMISGVVGHVSRPDVSPLTYYWQMRDLHGNTTGQCYVLGGGILHGRTPEAIVRRFSSDPLPEVSSKSEQGTARLVVDTAAHQHRPLDIFTGCMWKDRVPGTGPSSKLLPRNAWMHIKHPARTLIYDVYIHRDLAMYCAPDTDVFTTMTPDDIRDRWMNRLSDPPALFLLGRGISRCATPQYERHVELTKYMFESVGWVAEEFIGYRIEVEYPIWLAYYSIFFNPQYPSLELPT